MARPRRPKKPVPCRGTWTWNGEVFGCLQTVRSLAEVADAMVTFPAETRATGLRYWSERARLDGAGMVPWEDRDDADGTRWVGYRVDIDVPAFALELTARLCPGCARKEAERQGLVRLLVFIGCVGASPGRDERALEEWELLRVPVEVFSTAAR